MNLRYLGNENREVSNRQFEFRKIHAISKHLAISRNNFTFFSSFYRDSCILS